MWPIYLFGALVILLFLGLPVSFWQKFIGLRRAKKCHLQSFWEAISLLETQLLYLEKESIRLPEYKFFTALVYDIVSLTREFGIDGQTIIKQLKPKIQAENQFDREVQSLHNQAKLQFFMTGVTIWVFVFFSLQVLQIRLGVVAFLMLGLQLLGACLYWGLAKQLEHKWTQVFDVWFQALYRLKALIQVGIPLEIALRKSRALLVFTTLPEGLGFIEQRLKKSIQQLKEKGQALDDELESLMGELWFARQERFKRFKLFQTSLKFVILALFYLSGYFLYLADLFHTMDPI